MDLNDKINNSLSLLKKGEALALSLNPEGGYYLAFSGGKDSQVLLELARMAGVKYHAVHSVTGVDDPRTIYFIRENYPEVEMRHPKEKYLKLIEKKGMPTIQRRFCCERLKEGMGKGEVVLTGVRAEESTKRSKYGSIMIMSRRKEHQNTDVRRDEEWIKQTEHTCIKGQDRVMVHPVLDWTEDEVWQFLKQTHSPINPCYKMAGRVGCMFCPFASKRQIDQYERMYPGYKRAIIRALTTFWNKYQEHQLSSPEEYYEWWKTGKSVAQYKKMKAYM